MIGGLTMIAVIKTGGRTTIIGGVVGAVVGGGGDVGPGGGADVGPGGGADVGSGGDVGATLVGALVGASGTAVRVATGVNGRGVAEAMTRKSGVTVGRPGAVSGVGVSTVSVLSTAVVSPFETTRVPVVDVFLVAVAMPALCVLLPTGVASFPCVGDALIKAIASTATTSNVANPPAKASHLGSAVARFLSSVATNACEKAPALG